MFFLKKLVSRCFFPVPLCAGLVLLGLALVTFTRRKRTGCALAWTGGLLLLVFGYPWVPEFLLGRLEEQHPPVLERGARSAGSAPALDAAAPSSAAAGAWRLAPGFIFVLGQGVSADVRRPPNARVSEAFLQRITEGARLRRAFSNATLLVSVSSDVVSPAERWRLMGDLLTVYGLSTNGLGLCLDARDTEDEIRWCRRVAGSNQVLLVSCASHLPRAMVLARRHGLNAVPCPGGFAVDTVTPSPWSPTDLFPNADNLLKAEHGVYEFLGLAWEAVRRRGQTSGTGAASASTNRNRP